jgi:hypothetical protein
MPEGGAGLVNQVEILNAVREKLEEYRGCLAQLDTALCQETNKPPTNRNPFCIVFISKEIEVYKFAMDNLKQVEVMLATQSDA